MTCQGCKRLQSSDESITITKTNGCVCDLSVNFPPAGGAMGMSYPIDRAAAAGDGNEDIPCVDDCTQLPFVPKFAVLTIWSTEDGAFAFRRTSKGDGILTDGTAPLRQAFMFQNPVAGGGNAGDGLIGQVTGLAGSYQVNLGASPAATTLRLVWDAIGVAAPTVRGFIRVVGC